jgi:hypothetical protein
MKNRFLKGFPIALLEMTNLSRKLSSLTKD